MPDDMVNLDCDNCKHGHMCCTSFRVGLAKDEIDKYKYDEVLARRGVYVVAKTSAGHCCYFDPLKRKCKIWGAHPKECQKYDCSQDERVLPFFSRGVVVPKDEKYDGTVRVVLSVTVINGQKKCKSTPVMTQFDDRMVAADLIEFRDVPENVSIMATNYLKSIVDKRVKEIEAIHPKVEDEECQT